MHYYKFTIFAEHDGSCIIKMAIIIGSNAFSKKTDDI